MGFCSFENHPLSLAWLSGKRLDLLVVGHLRLDAPPGSMQFSPSSGLNTFGAGLPHTERIRLLQSSIEQSLWSCNHLPHGNREALTNSLENLFCYGSMTMNSSHRPAASQVSQSRSGKPRWPVESATPTSPSVYSQIIQIHGR